MVVSEISVNKVNQVRFRPYEFKKLLSLNAKPELFFKYTCKRCKRTAIFHISNGICVWCESWLSLPDSAKNVIRDPKGERDGHDS